MVKKELIKSIKEKESQISKLAVHVNKSLVCSELYNKVIIEKAILKKKLDELNENKLAQRVMRLFPRKEKLISDYFKN